MISVLPYEDGISEFIYHELFARIGRDEALQQNVFASRCANIKERAVLAYDSTTISTYSQNQTGLSICNQTFWLVTILLPKLKLTDRV